jgi:hypothetical protein
MIRPIKEKSPVALLAEQTGRADDKQSACYLDYSIKPAEAKRADKYALAGGSRCPNGALVNTYEYNFQTDYKQSKEKRFELLAGIKRLPGMYDYRVHDCMNFLPRQGEQPRVELVKRGQSFGFQGVDVCGSVWLCPVCNARISSERRRELAYAVEQSGCYTALITFTLSHGKQDRLNDLMGAIRKALNSTKSGRWYNAFLDDHDIIASASSLEITYGKNGWHPHIHWLVFMNKRPDSEAIKSQLSERFGVFIRKNGRYASSIYGVDVRATRKDVSGYISKWNVVKELSNVQAKIGRGESVSVWQLAQLAAAGDQDAARLWLEYAKATYRKKALTWSRGAKELFGLRDLDDAEIAGMPERPEIEPVHVVSFTVSEWHFILDHGLIGEVLYRARIEGAAGVDRCYFEASGRHLQELHERFEH